MRLGSRRAPGCANGVNAPLSCIGLPRRKSPTSEIASAPGMPVAMMRARSEARRVFASTTSSARNRALTTGTRSRVEVSCCKLVSSITRAQSPRETSHTCVRLVPETIRPKRRTLWRRRRSATANESFSRRQARFYPWSPKVDVQSPDPPPFVEWALNRSDTREWRRPDRSTSCCASWRRQSQ